MNYYPACLPGTAQLIAFPLGFMAALRLAFAALLLLGSESASAQALSDTLFSWRGYARIAQCHVSVYPAPPDEERTHTIVIRELADNRGPSTVDDARHLVELIGRQLQVDPAEAYWIFHWGAFSFDGAAPEADKELFLRATFRRTSTNRLGSPYWRVIPRADVRALTDRRFR